MARPVERRRRRDSSISGSERSVGSSRSAQIDLRGLASRISNEAASRSTHLGVAGTQ